MSALRWEVAARDVPGVGRVAFVVPVISEDMPPQLKNALAARRLATIEGKCPCGATLHLPNREQRRRAQRSGRQLSATVAHEPACDAADERITALLRAAR